MPVNLPDGWVYDKVFGAPASGGAMQKAMRPGGMNNALGGALPLMREALPVPTARPSHFAFDGGVDPGTPADVLTQTETAPVDPNPSPTVVPSEPDASTAGQTYPLLPLTVVPKPDAGSLAALKVPHDFNQRLAILALVLGFLSALTFILWRYHRRDYASPRRIGRRI
jgi:hypothetical protein